MTFPRPRVVFQSNSPGNMTIHHWSLPFFGGIVEYWKRTGASEPAEYSECFRYDEGVRYLEGDNESGDLVVALSVNCVLWIIPCFCCAAVVKNNQTKARLRYDSAPVSYPTTARPSAAVVGLAVAAPANFCPECGQYIAEETFCPACGARHRLLE